jgi:hypothetical protein
VEARSCNVSSFLVSGSTDTLDRLNSGDASVSMARNLERLRPISASSEPRGTMTNLLARIGHHANLVEAPSGARDDHATPSLSWKRVGLESEIYAVLAEPAFPGEQLAFAFKRKEQRLGDLFAKLNVADSRELSRRLALLIADDSLAAMFGRLVADRRARLVAFLADARRREALQRGRQQSGAYRAR